MYGPLKHYTAGSLDGTVVDPRFGVGATPTQPSGWGGGGGGGTAGPLLHVDTFGAVADGRDVYPVTVTTSSTTLTSSTSEFSADDVGKHAWVLSGSNVHKTTVTAAGSTTLTLAAPPVFPSTTATVVIGTDNGDAIAAAVTAALAEGEAGVQLGAGMYLTDQALPALTYSRDFRISGAGAGGMSYGYYTNMDISPGTELRFMGAGTGYVIDAGYTRGFQFDRLALRYAHPGFTGYLFNLDHTWGSYFSHFLLGGVWNASGARGVNEPRTMESQFTDGMIERLDIAHNASSGYNNASTYTRVVYLACRLTHNGTRRQATFLGCVWEPTGGGMFDDPVTQVSPVQGTLTSATFIGCGWWDAQSANGAWIKPGPSSSGIAIFGGYWEPRTANERLIQVQGPGVTTGLLIYGLRCQGFGASGSRLLELNPGASVTGLDMRGNTFNAGGPTSGLEHITTGLTFEADTGFHQVAAPQVASSTMTLRPLPVQAATLAADLTVAPPVMAAGSSMTIDLYVTQDATGNRALTWPTTIRWDGGSAPSLSTAAGATDHLRFTTLDGGATWLGALIGSYDA